MDELSAAELDEFARQLYAAFDTGWDFEEFIKLLFIAMGLDDVTVTSRTRDGGIDLTALRRGVGGCRAWTRSSTLRKQSATSLIPPQSWWTSGRSVALCRQAARVSSSQLGATRRMRESSPRRIPHVRFFFWMVVLSCSCASIMGLASDPGLCLTRPDSAVNCAAHRRVRPFRRHSPSMTCVSCGRLRPMTFGRASSGYLQEIVAEVDTSDGRLSVAFPPTVERRDYAYRADARFITGVTDILRAFGLLRQDGERVPKLGEWVLNRETSEVDVYVRHGIAPEGGSA